MFLMSKNNMIFFMSKNERSPANIAELPVFVILLAL